MQRYEESPALLQGTWHQVPIHRYERKGISKGEFRSVGQAGGGINALINEDCKDKDALALVKYISEEQKEEKLLVNQQVIKTPIVRNGKQATVGYAPEVWKGWS